MCSVIGYKDYELFVSNVFLPERKSNGMLERSTVSTVKILWARLNA